MPYFIILPAKIWEARAYYALGATSKAKEILTEAGITNDSPVEGGKEIGFLALCSIMLTEEGENYGDVGVILGQVEKLAIQGGSSLILLRARLMRAVLEEKQGNLSSADNHLINALETGKEGGFLQTFIDEGRKLEKVFKRIITIKKSNISMELMNYIEKIYPLIWPTEAANIDHPPVEKTPGETGSYSHDYLVEELSQRELEVLQLVSQGLSNQEISEKLFLTLGTVKWHTSNIYGKLGVKGRTQAVARARQIKVIT